MNQREALLTKVRQDPTAARKALFNKTRKGTKGLNHHQLVAELIRAGLGYYSF